jgi:uncharacterized protein
MAEFSPVTIPNTEIRRIQSKVTGREYQLFVGFPNPYTPAEKALPVLYMLDANLCVGAFEFLRLSQQMKEIQDFMLVGIGYPVAHFLETVPLRRRDYTPTVDPTEKAESSTLSSGQATQFLAFIREELFPFIEDTYPVVPSDRGIVGVSFGGLFALYTLFHQPDTFSRYVICSPSGWWDNEITFVHEEEYAAHHRQLKAKVFISAGSLEDDSIKQNMLKLSEQLQQRNYVGLALTTTILEGETHVSGVAAAICRGVNELYRSKE